MAQEDIKLSTIIGTTIVALAMFAKVPQIMKIHKSKSGDGISLSSVTMDLIAITIFMSYNFVKGFPFSAWGDALFMSIQTLVIAVLVLSYNGHPATAMAYVMVYLGICYILMCDVIPEDVLWTLQSINILIHFGAKSLQARTNYNNGHTGQLSAITVFLLFFGALGRIYTSIEDTGDPMLVLTNMVGSIGNGMVAAQVVYYWNDTEKLCKSA